MEIVFVQLTISEQIDKEREALKHFLYEALDNTDKHHIRIQVPPGVGKSYAMLEYIRDRPFNNYIIIVLDHQMVEGKDGIKEFLDHNIGSTNWVHIKGKTQYADIHEWDLIDNMPIIRREKMCEKENGTEYYPGCSDCPHASSKTCNYWIQYQELYHKRVIVTTIESISRLPDNRFIFFDESFDTKILKKPNRLLNQEMQQYFIFTEPKVEKIMAHDYTFYNHVELRDDFEVTSVEKYFIKAFMDYTDMIQARTTEIEGKLLLFGRMRIELPDYRKMIFNCATTPAELMINITDTAFLNFMGEPWYFYNCKYFKSDVVKNDVLRFTRNWTKQYSFDNIPIIFKFFAQSFITRNVLVITKKSFISPEYHLTGETSKRKTKKYIDDFLPGADYVWFGLRGTNKFNKIYDIVIIYGRYGLTPIDNRCLERIGIDKDMITLMDRSAMLQAVHRFRPLLHPQVPMIVMSDKSLSFETEAIPFRRWFDYQEHYDLEYKEIKSLRELNKVLGHTESYTKAASDYIKIMEFMDIVFYGI